MLSLPLWRANLPVVSHRHCLWGARCRPAARAVCGGRQTGTCRERSVTKYIAVSNRRGGVGKTTLTMMVAYGLAVTGRQRVLLVDLDAQASTSIVMMGHKRWREAREAKRTNAHLLTHLAGEEKIVI